MHELVVRPQKIKVFGRPGGGVKFEKNGDLERDENRQPWAEIMAQCNDGIASCVFMYMHVPGCSIC